MVASVQLRACSAEEVLAEVTRIVRRATGIGPARELSPEEPLGALGLDSLALVNAVAAVEAAFGNELPDALLEDRRGISIASLAAAGAVPATSALRTRHSASVPTAPEQGVSRVELLFEQLEARGAAGRAASGALHRAVILAHWARAHQPCVVLARDLAGELP